MATGLSSTKVAGGTLRRITHPSVSTKTDMTFAIFTPAATVEPDRERRVPPVRRYLLVRTSGRTAAASSYRFTFDRLAQRQRVRFQS